MAKAAAKGIPLGDYIKFHAPEPLVRAKLDRGELRYTWTDINGNERASDDGGELPPKGWWTRPEFTKIDYERHSVWGYAHIPPSFPPMYFVKVYPAVTPADTPVKPKRRSTTKFQLVLDILADIDEREGLPSDLAPAEVERKVLPEFRRRWAKLRPDDDTDPPVSRTVIYRAYQEFLGGLDGRPSP
jgi:hypothetical protein